MGKNENNNERIQQNVKEEYIECAGKKFKCLIKDGNVQTVWSPEREDWIIGEEWVFQECAGKPFLIYKYYNDWVVCDFEHQKEIIVEDYKVTLKECGGKPYICYIDFINPESGDVKELYDTEKGIYIWVKECHHRLELKEVNAKACIFEKDASGKIIAVKCDEEDLTPLLYEFLEHFEARYSLKKFLYYYINSFFTKK